MVVVKQESSYADVITTTSLLLNKEDLINLGLASPIKNALLSAQHQVDTNNPYVKDVYRAFEGATEKPQVAEVDREILEKFAALLGQIKGTSAANEQLAQITKQLKKQLEQSQKATSDLSLTTKLSERQKQTSSETEAKPSAGPKL